LNGSGTNHRRATNAAPSPIATPSHPFKALLIA
jgi:hypothetical protein